MEGEIDRRISAVATVMRSLYWSVVEKFFNIFKRK